MDSYGAQENKMKPRKCKTLLSFSRILRKIGRALHLYLDDAYNRMEKKKKKRQAQIILTIAKDCVVEKEKGKL